jgi:hypothetical protein
LGRSDTSAATPRVPSGCLTAAADRPHITASVDQLSRDGAADGACCADNYVQGIIRSIIVMLRLLAPIVPGASLREVFCQSGLQRTTCRSED